jgi:hypothetical protein
MADELERQNEPPSDIGPEAEMRERMLRERAEHEAILRALGIPIAGEESEEDDDMWDLDRYDYLLGK